MNICGIEVPNSLIRSARENRLVLFVGAGASRADPAGLPGFAGLVEEIAAGTNVERITLVEEGGATSVEPFDRFLGRLEKDHNVPVHQRAQQSLRREGSRPNHMHQAVIGLFPADAPLRVVTTNFDLHLEGALDGTPHEEEEVFRAPALPLGNDFQGIVYLHGRLEPEPKQMVLTDRDFGRAYLTEGWARRFLRQLFAAYDVLFVGYSHNDPVVSYLARGLPPDSDRQRFALSEEGRAEHWDLLDIRPIEYENTNGDHAQSGEFLGALGDFLGRGAASHAEYVGKLVRQGVENLKADGRDYLLFILGEANLRHLFFDAAVSPEWMLWMEELKQLGVLFEPLCEDHGLMQWFAVDLLGDRGETALAILSRKPYRYTSRALQIVLACELSSDIEDQISGGVSEEVLRRLTLSLSLFSNLEIDQRAAQFLGYLQKRLPVAPETLDIHLLIFQLITRPSAGLRSRSYPINEQPPAELLIRYAAKHHTAKAAWEHLSDYLELLATPLIPILTEHFTVARRLLRGAGQASERYDTLSFGRSAIEPHEQDIRHYVVDVLIDAARDCLEHLNQSNAAEAQSTLEAWIRSDVLLLRRLAVHGLPGNSKLSVPKKVDLMLSVPGLLRDSYARHELFHTLRHCYAHGSRTVRKKILAARKRGLRQRYQPGEFPEQAPETLKVWEAQSWLTFLTWLAEEISDCSTLDDALAEIKAAHPGLQPQTDHPDLNSRMRSGFVEMISPLAPEEVAQLAPPELLVKRQELAARPRTDFLVNEVGGLDETVEQVAGEDFSWGIALARHLADEEDAHEDFWHALFRAWSKSEMTEQGLRELMEFLAAQSSLVEREKKNIAAFLKDRFGPSKGAVEAESLAQATTLAGQLWPLLEGSFRVLENDDLYMEVINNPLGHLGRFAIGALSRHRNDFNHGLEEVPDLEHLLNLIAADADGERHLGAVALTAQLSFLLAAAPEWTNEHLMPLLDWERNEETALALWTGFFRSFRLPRLTDEFLDGIACSFSHTQRFDKTTRQQIPEYVVALLDTDPNALTSQWLSAFLQGSEDSDRALMWQKIRYSLGDRQEGQEENLFDAMWQARGKALVERRLAGGRPDLEEEEWEAIVDLCPRLDAFFVESVDLIERHRPAPRLERGMDALHWLASNDSERSLEHLWRYPNGLGRYLVYILSAQEPPAYWLSELRKVLLRLQETEGVEEALLTRLRDRYVELGGRTEDLRS